mgnify:CR=1 FL=1
MDIYVSEQEQAETIKRWAKENGPGVIAGLILGFGGLFGWRYWQGEELEKAANASTGYQEMQSLLIEEHFSNAMLVGERIQEQDSDTTYAMFAALMVARLQIDNGDLDGAARQLQRVIERAKIPAIVALAERRLSEVYLSEGKPDEAWVLVESIATFPEQASLHELRGDILLARGRTAAAKHEYTRSLSIAEEKQQSLNVIQLKLDDLGSYEGTQADLQ